MKKIVGVILIIISIFFLYEGFIGLGYMLSNRLYNKNLRKAIISKSVDEYDEIDNIDNSLNRIIDFDKLKSINEDIKAWLYIPETKIDYPILSGESDEEYLYKGINKEYTPLGSLFSFSGTDFTKGNTTIFGHNMAGNQMFGELKKYIYKDFLKEHRYLYIYTESKVIKCDIFSIFIANENDNIFKTEYELETEEYVSFIEEINKRNNYSDYYLDLSDINNSKRQVFSLITCYGSEGTNERLVVNAIESDLLNLTQ